MLIICKGNRIYLVRSSDKINWYEVDLRYGTDGICTCKAFLKNSVFCKHIKEVKARIRDNMIGIAA